MAPFTPYISEHVTTHTLRLQSVTLRQIYQNLKNAMPEDLRMESIHFSRYPQTSSGADNQVKEHQTARVFFSFCLLISFSTSSPPLHCSFCFIHMFLSLDLIWWLKMLETSILYMQKIIIAGRTVRDKRQVET
eukprot:765966-Hanusia_phi.AAC.14